MPATIVSNTRQNKPPVIKQDPSVGINNSVPPVNPAPAIEIPVIKEAPVNPQPVLNNDLEAEISLKFLEEYRALCRKWKRDFVQGEIHVVKVDFID
jgi:hypothetical protein